MAPKLLTSHRKWRRSCPWQWGTEFGHQT